MARAFQVFQLLAITCVLAGCVQMPDAVDTDTPSPLVSTQISSKEPEKTSLPTSAINSDPIKLAWFYKPPVNDDLELVARDYDFFILTRMDEKERDMLSSRRKDTDVLQYLLFGEIQEPGSCTEQPRHNQVAEQIGDYCQIFTNHRDWFLQDTFGNIVMNDDGYQLMDPSNLEWRKFWLERAIISQEKLGWRGVFLDNVEASLEKRIRYGALPRAYPTDTSYQEAVADFLKDIYTGYFLPNHRPLYANIISLNEISVWEKYLAYLDGAMIENFAVDWEGYKDLPEWDLDLQLAERAQAMGKTVILVSQGEKQDEDRQLFALASYLLINDGQAYFRYSNDRYYDEIWLYGTYQMDLGNPAGSRYQDGKIWVREFDHGTVRVDPSQHSAEIEFK